MLANCKFQKANFKFEVASQLFLLRDAVKHPQNLHLHLQFASTPVLPLLTLVSGNHIPQ
jgi:hypothetical protein